MAQGLLFPGDAAYANMTFFIVNSADAPGWARDMGRNILFGGNTTYQFICLSPPPYPPQMPPPPTPPVAAGCPCITAFPNNANIYTTDNLNLRVNVLGNIFSYPLTCALHDPRPVNSAPSPGLTLRHVNPAPCSGLCTHRLVAG